MVRGGAFECVHIHFFALDTFPLSAHVTAPPPAVEASANTERRGAWPRAQPSSASAGREEPDVAKGRRGRGTGAHFPNAPALHGIGSLSRTLPATVPRAAPRPITGRNLRQSAACTRCPRNLRRCVPPPTRPLLPSQCLLEDASTFRIPRVSASLRPPPPSPSPPLQTPPLCDIPSGCGSFTGPWTVTRPPLRMLRRVAAFCRPLRPVLLLVSFPRSRSPVVGALGLCWLLRGSFDCFCCPHTSVLSPPPPPHVLNTRSARLAIERRSPVFLRTAHPGGGPKPMQ